MFRATFLGHQGWLVSSPGTRVLIDPLLTAQMGHGGLVGDLYPPKHIDLAAFPAVDAVVLTHEHDDHFDLASLHKIDRAVPVYLSARSSAAAFEVLKRIGFTVSPLQPGTEHRIGGLCYHTLTSEHRTAAAGDEWDVLPFVLHDKAGHGSMFSSVDLRPDERALAALKALGVPPGIWCYACNATAPAFGRGSATDDTETLARVVRRRYAEVEDAWGAPAVTAIVGAGWSYAGERAWMNRRVFPIDLERLALDLRSPPTPHPVRAMVPGQTIEMFRGTLANADAAADFISLAPRETWPSRDPVGPAPSDARPVRATKPARDLRANLRTDLKQLAASLDDYARFLYGGALFRELHSAETAEVDHRRVAFCFDLLQGDDRQHAVLAYAPSSCRFVPCDLRDPEATFLSGLSCWADDLAGFLEGRLGPAAFCNAGRVRPWNHRPDILRVSVHDLWTFGHPLRRPDAHRRLYAALAGAQRDVPPAIRLSRRAR